MIFNRLGLFLRISPVINTIQLDNVVEDFEKFPKISRYKPVQSGRIIPEKVLG
jgi:hypothetical protein